MPGFGSLEVAFVPSRLVFIMMLDFMNMFPLSPTDISYMQLLGSSRDFRSDFTLLCQV